MQERMREKNWFLRGVQSAVFYYLSCTPCSQANYRRKRRKEAAQAQKPDPTEVVTIQPGLIAQPRAFQTNEDWAEELLAGPGPPPGWKGDELIEKLKKRMRKETTKQKEIAAPMNAASSSTVANQDSGTDRTDWTSPSSSTLEPIKPAPTARPTHERRLSTAFENLKDTLKSSLHPSGWNLKRYEREDEIFTGFGDKVSQMWAKATGNGPDEHDKPSSLTTPYDRAIHPSVNDHHPPVVSQLPPTREEGAWMIRPPPSRAVMEGKKRPAAETEPRWPLAVIGRQQQFPEIPLSPLSVTDTASISSEESGPTRFQENMTRLAISR